MITSFFRNLKFEVRLLTLNFALLDRAALELCFGAKFSKIYGAVFKLWANRVCCLRSVMCILTSHNEVRVE